MLSEALSLLNWIKGGYIIRDVIARDILLRAGPPYPSLRLKRNAVFL